MQSLKEFATFAEVMRFVGAGIIVSAMAMLLFKGWHDGNDINRYIKLLSMTGLLSVGGLMLSYVMGEPKGARVFYHLSHLSVPINFGILGALLYSLFPDSHLLHHYPTFTLWQVTDGGKMVLTALSAMVVLVPVSLLGFKLLDRDRATVLSIWFLGLNSLLLLPFRTPMLVSLIFVLALLGATMGYMKIAASDDGQSSTRSRYGRLLLFIPAVQILLRNLYLYELNGLVGLIIFCGIYISLRVSADKNPESPLANLSMAFLSLPMAIGAAVCAADVVPLMQGILKECIFTLVLAAYMVDTKLRVQSHSIINSINLGIAGLLISGIVVISVLSNPNMLEAVLNILISAALIGFGLWSKQRPILILGVLVLLFASWVGLEDFIQILFQGSWIAMAVTGSLVILSASLIERYGALLKMKYLARMSRDVESEG